MAPAKILASLCLRASGCTWHSATAQQEALSLFANGQLVDQVPMRFNTITVAASNPPPLLRPSGRGACVEHCQDLTGATA